MHERILDVWNFEGAYFNPERLPGIRVPGGVLDLLNFGGANDYDASRFINLVLKVGNDTFTHKVRFTLGEDTLRELFAYYLDCLITVGERVWKENEKLCCPEWVTNWSIKHSDELVKLLDVVEG